MGKGEDVRQKFSCRAALTEETSSEEKNLTWEQSDEAVIINLNLGQKVKRKNVMVELSKYTASVFIANERKWRFKLFDGILPKESRFKLSHTKLVLIMKKVYYCYTWLGLESSGRMPLWSPEELDPEKKKNINGQHVVTSSVEQLKHDKQVKSREGSVKTKQRRKKKRVKGVITDSETQYETKIQHPGYDDDICILGAMISGFHDDPTEVADCAKIKFLQSDVNNQKSRDNSPANGQGTNKDNVAYNNPGKDKLPSFYDLFVCKPRRPYRS